MTFGDWLAPDDSRFWNPVEFNPRHWVVRTKTGALQPFNLWSHQVVMSAALMRAYSENKFIAMVKPRKLGSSTFWTGVATQHAMFREGCFAKVVAQRDEVAQELAGVAKRFYRYCGSPYRPEELKGLKRTIEIPAHNAKLDIGSVGQDDPGRGSSGLQFLLATEICKWKNADAAWSSLLANVPAKGGMVVAESTPLFHGDPLHQLHEHALKPDSPWLSLFIPWTLVDEYAIDPPPGWNPTDDVLDYANRHGLSDAQAYWMAVKGLQDTKGRLDLFRAEYPIDVVDCWMPGGEAIFDVERLTGALKVLDGNTGVLSEEEPFKQWEKPPARDASESDVIEWKKKRFVIACDPAGSFGERDMWGIEVLNVTNCTQAAEFLGHSNAFAMAKMMADLGKEYNNATIYVESNGVGEAVLSHLIMLGYPYIYFRPEGNKPGFHSNKTSKAQAIGLLQELIHDGSFTPRSQRLIKQCLNYRGQWDGFGSRDVKGGHYDLVAAAAIVAWAWRNEGGGTKRGASAPTQAERHRAYSTYMAALDRIHSQGQGSTDRDTPWGSHL